MINEYNIDIGRNADTRYTLNLNKETGVIIAGYTGSGKTNLIDYIKSQLLMNDCEIFNYDKKIKIFDKTISEKFKSNFNLEYEDSKIFSELKKHKKEIEKRIKETKKSKLTYDEYVKENDNFKDRFIFIDEFSTGLLNLKLLEKARYDKYLDLLHFIIKEGSSYGYRLIICGLRCRNSDIPEVLSKEFSCKISFTNPYKDLEDWGLIEEGMKFPKKVGELLIVSNTCKEKTFVKSYNVEEYKKEKKFIFGLI